MCGFPSFFQGGDRGGFNKNFDFLSRPTLKLTAMPLKCELRNRRIESGIYLSTQHYLLSNILNNSSNFGVRMISVRLFFCLASGVLPSATGENSPLPAGTTF